jgi:hypothetical protein
MPEPILSEYLLKLATDPNARDRFIKLNPTERLTFLKTLGLHDGPARALADGDDKKIAAAVESELQPRGGNATSGGRHTIQMSIEVQVNPATHEK